MMKAAFEKELRESLYVHYPLPLHREGSLEAGFAEKEVDRKQAVWTADCQPYTFWGVGCGTVASANGVIEINSPTRFGTLPEGAVFDRDYCNYGEARLRFNLNGEDLRGFNRLHFWVRPQINGAHVACLCAGVKNEGEIPVPDEYGREGNTVWDLQLGEWNECFWEFAAMPRDKITELDFYIYLNGGDAGTEKQLKFELKDIYLENVPNPEIEHGWQCREGEITFSTVGYWPGGKKTAVANTDEKNFAVFECSSGQEVFHGEVKTVKNEHGEFKVLDFSGLQTEGEYFISLGDGRTHPFVISETLCEESLWRAINFLYCERCGTVVPHRHGMCHMDTVAEHNGEIMSFAGGWHDAGDVSQQTVHTAEAACALAETASHCAKGSLLRRRLVEEAVWGLEFVLRTRFGDGFRLTSAGATRWTDNRIGNFDDINARVYNKPYENFLFAGIEAAAAVYIKEDDPAFAWSLQNAARQDFKFAKEKFAQSGACYEQVFEHTYNSGLSQHYACMTWAAGCLFSATGDESYALAAREAGAGLLACQETGDKLPEYAGFFYRDETHKTIVHFNHQAREHQFAEALYSLCTTQPNAAEYPQWVAAARRYGDYLLKIAGNTAPYGMIPAGVHRMDEVEDEETYQLLHITTAFETEKQNYLEQLKNGTPIDKNHVLKNFPVWFSFRGNNAVLLSMGKSASLMGRLLKDERLTEIAREQMYWLWGKNPFGQSMMYGSGSSWCAQYAVLCGEAAGEIPVGIETLGNEDVPYWPQNNNATFREVWVASVAHWLRLAADLMPDENK